jgi:hypothetical protein
VKKTAFISIPNFYALARKAETSQAIMVFQKPYFQLGLDRAAREVSSKTSQPAIRPPPLCSYVYWVQNHDFWMHCSFIQKYHWAVRVPNFWAAVILTYSTEV